MSRFCWLASLLLVSPAMPATAQALPALNCTGPFARAADERTVAEVFGAAHVTRADIPIGEGSTEPGTVVFADDKEKRIDILWHDPAARARPAAVIFRNGSTWRVALAGSQGRSVGLGMPLTDVEALNGKPFGVNGFGWDGGGFAGTWHDGELARPAGGCTLTLRFDQAADAPADALDKTNGDIELLSSDPVLRQTRPVVSEVVLGWPQ